MIKFFFIFAKYRKNPYSETLNVNICKVFVMNLAQNLKRIMSLGKKFTQTIMHILRLDLLYKKFRSLQVKYHIAIGIALLALYVASKFLFAPAWPEDIKVVEVHKASKENFRVTTKLMGSIEAKKYFTIEAINPGIIEYIAEAGIKLKKNERIAAIDAPEIEEAYESAAKALSIAKQQYNREIKLLSAGASSNQKVEQKYISLSQASNVLASAKTALDKVVFLAPFDGIVGSPLLFHGSKANPGDKIVTFYDDEALVVKFDIPSSIAIKIPSKTKARIDGIEYNVYVQKALSKNSYSIPAYLEFTCGRCIIGEVAELDLYVVNKENVMVLPTSCVFIMNGAPAVYKVVDGKAELSMVKVGDRQEDKVEILDGVEVGDIIIAEGQGRLYPTIKVKVYEGE